MDNEKLTAKYKNQFIELNVPNSFYLSNIEHFNLFKNDTFLCCLSPISQIRTANGFTLVFNAKEIKFIPGEEYFLVSQDNFYVPIDYSFIAFDQSFERQYRYDGELGALYSKEKTIFRVYSPLASQIILMLKKQKEKDFASYLMKKDKHTGVFEIEIKEDIEKAEYYYFVNMFSQGFKVIDPYSFSTNANSQISYVIDLNKIKNIKSNNNSLPPLKSIEEAIIYETNVRDMTSLSNIEKKSTYHAFVKPGLKMNKVPIGIDYLKYINPTHVELQPVLDFQTVDDLNPTKSYNWGYDPLLYFSFEGSYATNPNDPYNRLLEMKELVSKLHKEGLRVILDVVYNHVYSSVYNPLSLLVPNYYFRVNANKELSTGSGCGNEIESRNYMARKLIIDSALYLIDLLDIDGFRFDLVSLIDIETLNILSKKIYDKKQNFLLFGEGWDLHTSLEPSQKASMYNADKLTSYSFFNDRFRDVVKGNSNENQLEVKGYLLGDTNYLDGFKHVFLGSTTPIAFAPLFKKSFQSINYVECHDNHTLFDKIKSACKYESEDIILRSIKTIIIANLFACGVPFFHMGEEIGQSKNMIGNTYNSGDLLNGFNFEIANQRRQMINYFKEAIELKKEFILKCGDAFYSLSDKISFDSLPYGSIKVNFELEKFELYIIFNPTRESFMYTFDSSVKQIFSINGKIESKKKIHLVTIEGISVGIYILEKEN